MREDSPTYRRYVPFEPYAEVVREIFRLFVELDGNVYQTHRTLKARGIKFPSLEEVPPPIGFKVNYEHQRRNPYPDITSLRGILSNPVYIGHFTHGKNGAIIHWRNHEPLISEELFYSAYNLISPYDLVGNENPEYRGNPVNSRRPTKEETRTEDRPLCEGLLWVCLEDKWNRAGVRFKDEKYQYAFDQQNQKPGSLSWRRDAAYIDEAVIYLLKMKVMESASPSSILRSLKEGEESKRDELKSLDAQIASLDKTIDNQVAKIEALSDLSLIGTLEKRYTEMKRELDRLTAKRDQIAQSTEDSSKNIEHIMSVFYGIYQLEQMPHEVIRKIVLELVTKVSVVSLGSRKGMSGRIEWYDKTSVNFELQKMGQRDTKWSFTEMESLRRGVHTYCGYASKPQVAQDSPSNLSASWCG